jgi:hypothetical protein
MWRQAHAHAPSTVHPQLSTWDGGPDTRLASDDSLTEWRLMAHPFVPSRSQTERAVKCTPFDARSFSTSCSHFLSFFQPFLLAPRPPKKSQIKNQKSKKIKTK